MCVHVLKRRKSPSVNKSCTFRFEIDRPSRFCTQNRGMLFWNKVPKWSTPNQDTVLDVDVSFQCIYWGDTILRYFLDDVVTISLSFFFLFLLVSSGDEPLCRHHHRSFRPSKPRTLKVSKALAVVFICFPSVFSFTFMCALSFTGNLKWLLISTRM